MDMPKIDQEQEMTRKERISVLQKRIESLGGEEAFKETGSYEVAQKVMNGVADLDDSFVSEADLTQLEGSLWDLENTGSGREEREEEEEE